MLLLLMLMLSRVWSCQVYDRLGHNDVTVELVAEVFGSTYSATTAEHLLSSSAEYDGQRRVIYVTWLHALHCMLCVCVAWCFNVLFSQLQSIKQQCTNRSVERLCKLFNADFHGCMLRKITQFDSTKRYALFIEDYCSFLATHCVLISFTDFGNCVGKIGWNFYIWCTEILTIA